MERPTHKDNVVKVATLCLKEHSRRQQEEDGGVLQSSLIQHRLTLATYTEHEKKFQRHSTTFGCCQRNRQGLPTTTIIICIRARGASARIE